MRLSAHLTHPSMRGVELLTDASTSAATLTDVVLVADVFVRPDQVDGALVVVVAAPDRSEWRLDAFLSRAQAAGAAGVLIAGCTPLQSSTRHLADRLGMPVLGAGEVLATYSTVADLLTRPGTEVARTVMAAVSACWSGPSTTEEIVAGLTHALGRQAFVLDTAARVVIGPDLLADKDRSALAARLSEAGQPLAPLAYDLTSVGEVVVLRMAGVGQTSWLCVHLPASIPPERAAVEAALPVAAGAIQERLARRRLQLERTARSRTSLLEEITRSPTDVSQVMRSRALGLGWKLDGWHIGIYVGVIGEVDLTGVREELLSAFADQDLTVEAVEQGDGWAVWTTTDSEPSTEDAVRQAAAIRRAQRRLNSAARTYVGVGRAVVGAQGIARSLAEARDAARLAQGREETGRFLHVDRLGFGQLLLGWTRTNSFLPAANALLAPLTRASGGLVNTLGAYLDCESSLAHTAAVLGVHRNTVAARIARIQELLGVDLSNPDERLALHLACKRSRYRAAPRIFLLVTPDPTGPRGTYAE